MRDRRADSGIRDHQRAYPNRWRARQQPQERHNGVTAGPADLRRRGVGFGKSTLINGTLYPLAATALNGATTLKAAPHSIDGLEQPEECIDIDQSPIETPRSNPATYTGIFTPIRELFAGTRSAFARLQTRALQF